MTNAAAEVILRKEFEQEYHELVDSEIDFDRCGSDSPRSGEYRNNTVELAWKWLNVGIVYQQFEIARLREALEYYASDNIYLSNWRIKSIVMEDKGSTAKQALNPAVASSKED